MFGCVGGFIGKFMKISRKLKKFLVPILDFGLFDSLSLCLLF